MRACDFAMQGDVAIGSSAGSGHRESKTLGIFRVVRVPLCSRDRPGSWGPLGSFRVVLGFRKTKAGLEGWSCQSPTQPLTWREGLEMSQSPLAKDVINHVYSDTSRKP